jgi:hypothetical protein
MEKHIKVKGAVPERIKKAIEEKREWMRKVKTDTVTSPEHKFIKELA